MDPVVRFWLLMLALAGTISAAILLVTSAFLPGAILGEADTVGYPIHGAGPAAHSRVDPPSIRSDVPVT